MSVWHGTKLEPAATARWFDSFTVPAGLEFLDDATARGSAGPVRWSAFEDRFAGTGYEVGLHLSLIAALVATPLAWATLARRRPPPGHCRSCGYDLTANASGRCPECGAAVQPLVSTEAV